MRDEFHAARFSLQETLRTYYVGTVAAKEGPSREQITFAQLELCARHLHVTYLLRLFAEFEGVLRDYWLNGRKRPTEPQMADLMNSIAAYCFMNADDVQDAHEVRAYRNDVIHERAIDARLDFHTCRSRIARFVRWLPKTW